MAEFQQRDNSGFLFKNDKREKDSHPNATGTVMIDGIEYFINAWTKDGAKGKFQSLSFKRKEKQPQQPQGQQSTPTGSFDDMADDIPF